MVGEYQQFLCLCDAEIDEIIIRGRAYIPPKQPQKVAFAHVCLCQQVGKAKLLLVIFAQGLCSLQNDLPRAGGFGLGKTALRTQGKHSVQSKADLHHAVHGATLHLRQNRFKKFLHLDPGDLHRSQFFDWKQERLHSSDPCTIQMNPIMMPTTLVRCSTVALRGAAVEQQCLSGAERDMVSVLLDQTCAVEGDIKVSMAMSILKTIAGCGQLSEMYSIDFNEDICIIGHSGSGDADISEKKPTMKIVPVFHGKTGGGYLTYRMQEEEVAQCRPFFDEQPREWVNMGVQADNLAGEYFITTGSGKFFRNVEPDPVHSIGIVEINDKGDSWRIVWGLEGGAKPTSEFPSHFMNHSVRKAATNGANRVIYHCHATNVIALTYILPLTDRDFTRALWQSATECPVVFPEGVGVCPWMVPGGADIAMATSELMKTYQAAIWAQHGLFASGPDFDITFGLAHTIEKSAEIYVKVLSMGGGIIRQTITDDDLRAIARDFGVTLNEKFLN